MANTHRWHAEIVSAVVAGDASRAETRVAEHFAEVAAWMEAGLQDGGTIAPASAFAFRDGGWPRVKLAEVVAARIYDDIVAQGRKIGSVLGSEYELIERYDTSRAVLRAAVRLLEHHSIACARRGTRGGLVITRPQPRACVDTAALYLAFRGATAADLSHVREAIELGVVEDVTARRAQPGIARGLQLLADRLSADSPPGGTPPAGGFHAELAELGANPVLCLFLQIISDLTERIRSVNGQAAPAGSPSDETCQVHQGVLDAIREGDTALAQHRLRRHLGTRSPACEAGSGTHDAPAVA
jgi:DNA-binding FadR family transcriptional regulator